MKVITLAFGVNRQIQNLKKIYIKKKKTSFLLNSCSKRPRILAPKNEKFCDR